MRDLYKNCRSSHPKVFSKGVFWTTSHEIPTEMFSSELFGRKHKGSSFCGTPVKQIAKIGGLRLPKIKLCGFVIIKTAKLLFILIVNFEPVKQPVKKRLFRKIVIKRKSYYKIHLLTNYTLRVRVYTVTNTRFELAME